MFLGSSCQTKNVSVESEDHSKQDNSIETMEVEQYIVEINSKQSEGKSQSSLNKLEILLIKSLSKSSGSSDIDQAENKGNEMKAQQGTGTNKDRSNSPDVYPDLELVSQFFGTFRSLGNKRLLNLLLLLLLIDRVSILINWEWLLLLLLLGTLLGLRIIDRVIHGGMLLAVGLRV